MHKPLTSGSGDERPSRESAILAISSLEGWTAGETILFKTMFQFDDDDDFFTSMLPGYRQQPASFVDEVTQFLDLYRTENGIILDADRRLNVLRNLNLNFLPMLATWKPSV